MILVQRTSWHNANIALKNLKKDKLLSLSKISSLKSLDKLTQLIRPAGFFQSKPKKLFDICTFIMKNGGVSNLMKGKTEDIRSELLNIKGIGLESADTILLYALDKPVFVIDEYTRRWFEKNHLSPERNYSKLQQFFQTNLKPDLTTYQYFHALIIISQRGRDKSKMEVI